MASTDDFSRRVRKSIPSFEARSLLLNSLFDQMPFGIALFDTALILQEYNDNWLRLADRYAPLSLVRVKPGMHLDQLFPGETRRFHAIAERVLAGDLVRQEGMRLERDGVLSYLGCRRRAACRR